MLCGQNNSNITRNTPDQQPYWLQSQCNSKTPHEMSPTSIMRDYKSNRGNKITWCLVVYYMWAVTIREYGGEIFTDYYFGEANTANKSDNYHNNATNKNFNWGGISGLLQLATTTSGSCPEIQDGPGGRRGGEAGDDEELNTTNKDSTPC